MKELLLLLHTNDFVLFGNSWKVEIRYKRWKKPKSEKDLKVNVKKTNAFCTSKRTVAIETSEFPCSVCR